LLEEQEIAIVADPGGLVVAGEKAVFVGAWSSNNPREVLNGVVGTTTQKGGGTWTQYIGIMKKAQAPKTAIFYHLFLQDPEWIQKQFDDTRFPVPPPYIGFPTLPDRNPNVKANLEALRAGNSTFETPEITAQIIENQVEFTNLLTQR
jgi:hypothetical protein